MRCAPFALLAFVVALTIQPAPAWAQDWSQPWADEEDRPPRVDISVSGGFLMPTRWSDLVLFGSASPAAGALEQVLTRDVHVESDSTFAGVATYWKGRYGFRSHLGFSRSSLRFSGGALAGTPPSSTATNGSGEIATVGVDTWFYDVGGAIGFVEYTPARRVWPYGFIGLGGITYKLKRTIVPPLAFIARGPSQPDTADTIIVVDADRQFLLTTNALSTENVLALNFGVGTDLRIPLGRGGIALRLELADHVGSSPLAFRVEELSPFGGVSDTGVRYRLVHHLSATAGVVVQIGR